MRSYCKSCNVWTEILAFDVPLNVRENAKLEEFILKVVMFDKMPLDNCIAATIAMEEAARKWEKYDLKDTHRQTEWNQHMIPGWFVLGAIDTSSILRFE